MHFTLWEKNLILKINWPPVLQTLPPKLNHCFTYFLPFICFTLFFLYAMKIQKKCIGFKNTPPKNQYIYISMYISIFIYVYIQQHTLHKPQKSGYQHYRICGIFHSCSIFSIQYADHNIQCSVISVKCVVCSKKCTVVPMKCVVLSVQCVVWSVQVSVWNVHCTVWSVQCTVWSVQWSVLNVQWSKSSV